MILCNPPYVNSGSMDALPQEYLHEPQLAWLAARTAWTWCAASWKPRRAILSDEGVLVLEIGHERDSFEAAFPSCRPCGWTPRKPATSFCY